MSGQPVAVAIWKPSPTYDLIYKLLVAEQNRARTAARSQVWDEQDRAIDDLVQVEIALRALEGAR